MAELFDSIRELNQSVMRNIVNVSKTAFSDLYDHEKDANKIANAAISNVMNPITTDLELQFHYMTAIHYPFETDHFMLSRFSDGTFPIWYGSLELETTIHETVHHMIKEEMKIENFSISNVITRERLIYQVFCHAILIDLTNKVKNFPELLADDHTVTQKIGKELAQQGFPGLLASSARFDRGTNINIFKNEVLSHPQIETSLTYQLVPSLKKVIVTQNNQKTHEIYF